MIVAKIATFFDKFLPKSYYYNMVQSIIIKKRILELFLIFILVFLSACANKVAVRESEQFQGTAVMHYPMIAKKEIKKEKISHAYAGSQCYIETSCEMLAYNDALKTLKIDGILEPVFYHKVFPFEVATVTVTGYPYIYTEFREVTKEDRDLLVSPGSTWIPMQTNNRPYITNTNQTPLWQIILVSLLVSSTIVLIAAN
jgi:hypothetical protein